MYAVDLTVDKNLVNQKVLKYRILAGHVMQMGRGDVLEFGCGAGTMVRTLARDFPDLNFEGYDVDQKAIEHGSKHPEPNLKFLDHMNKAGKYDIIFMMDVLEHVPEPHRVLVGLRERLKPGGKLIIHVPLEKSGIYSIPWCRDVKTLNSDHVVFFDYKDIVWLTEGADLMITDRHFHYHFIGGLRDFLKYLTFINMKDAPKTVIYTTNWCSGWWKRVMKTLDWLSYHESVMLKDTEFFASGVTVCLVHPVQGR